MSGVQTVLAFDLGLARTGVAVGNTLTCLAQPHTVLHASNKTLRLAAAQVCIKQWQAQLLVIGLPCHPDGAPHDMTRAAINFAKNLRDSTQLPICMVDERYSSAIDGVNSDAQAAAVILQQYFQEGGISLDQAIMNVQQATQEQADKAALTVQHNHAVVEESKP